MTQLNLFENQVTQAGCLIREGIPHEVLSELMYQYQLRGGVMPPTVHTVIEFFNKE